MFRSWAKKRRQKASQSRSGVKTCRGWFWCCFCLNQWKVSLFDILKHWFVRSISVHVSLHHFLIWKCSWIFKSPSLVVVPGVWPILRPISIISNLAEFSHESFVLFGNGWVLPNSEVISPKPFCRFVFTMVIDMNLGLPCPYNSLNNFLVDKTDETKLVYHELLGNAWDLPQVLTWYLPTQSVDLSLKGPKMYMTLGPPFLQDLRHT